MYANQYEEHLAHSAPCSSRWDGFDRGDIGHDEPAEGSVVIGRMTSNGGARVVITYEWAGDTECHRVTVDGRTVFFEEDARDRAIATARQLLAD